MPDTVHITGIQKLTLLDYPDRMAAVLFLPGCNMACPFCHNSEIIHGTQPVLNNNEILSFLENRKRLLTGVVITGGEPSLQDIRPLLQDIKDIGYNVKVDTNGLHPEHIKEWLDEKLVDYLAMDIKNSPTKYAMTAGLNNIDLHTIDQSIMFLKQSTIPHEFRTTVTPSLHTVQDIVQIGQWIGETETFFIQPFVDRETVPNQNLLEPTDDFLIECLDAVKPFVSTATIRGRDVKPTSLTD